MAKYRKKPVVIDAVLYSGYNGDRLVFDEVPEWFTKAIGDYSLVFDDSDKQLKVNTLEGEMIVSPGDYIIRGVKGEIYPCKPDIFEMTYTLDLTDKFKREILAEWVEGSDEDDVQIL